MSIAVVTGGSSGIGLGVVQKLTANGYSVINFDIREPVEKISGDFCSVDITDSEAIRKNMDLVQEKYGTLDVLVNAAGVFDNFTPCDQTSDQLWKRVLDIDLTGTFNTCRAALKIMQSAQSGSIVNISSIAGLSSQGGGAAYCAAKHAVIGLTRSIAAYYGPQGIRANVVCPGIINTNIVQTSKETFMATGDWNWGESDKRPKIKVEDKVPLGRMGTSQELAETVFFLVSNAGSYVSGHVMVVDGGWIA